MSIHTVKVPLRSTHNEIGRYEDLLEFERLLLSHVDICYSVALLLTRRRPKLAEELTRQTMRSVWHLRTDPTAKDNIKTLLLQELRLQFLKNYATLRMPPPSESAALVSLIGL